MLCVSWYRFSSSVPRRAALSISGKMLDKQFSLIIFKGLFLSCFVEFVTIKTCSDDYNESSAELDEIFNDHMVLIVTREYCELLSHFFRFLL